LEVNYETYEERTGFKTRFLVNCEGFARALKSKLAAQLLTLELHPYTEPKGNVTYVLPFKKWNALEISVRG
jgi:hypothetical protein